MTLNWSVVTQNLGIFFEGAALTLQISALALIISIPIGVIIGLLRVSNNKILSLIAVLYVEFMRGVPLLVLLIWIYFVMGQFLNLGAYWSAVLGLAIFSGAFIAEIVRSGIQSVPRGQMEAARSSGMSYMKAMMLVILPQAVRTVLPPMASQFIILIKDSSLVSTISVVDLTLVGKNLVATTFRSLEVWTFIALLYFVMTFTLSQIIRYYERKYTIKQ
ncbi:polar amino acid transport system permease protein [Sedimentibacter acidaminivorans]|uniref:Polar amino acid transport system permease protein n=1 Tax=Sedimentibacter acidaminivorans TaxID=913099 RepID=A0ABS4G990_9FIRM|nr:amino acid ABC transporter permease [Sedimentibacter acidaminivorans]MBP1924231.1 polar amino acid transport system permease protein [Sedimentibacter acidaminivorans]